jgi:hypothetical protein
MAAEAHQIVTLKKEAMRFSETSGHLETQKETIK